MAPAQHKTAFQKPPLPQSPISQEESARYTADILESLRQIATQQGHPVLAHLLELAQAEAKMLIRDLKNAPAP